MCGSKPWIRGLEYHVEQVDRKTCHSDRDLTSLLPHKSYDIEVAHQDGYVALIMRVKAIVAAWLSIATGQGRAKKRAVSDTWPQHHVPNWLSSGVRTFLSFSIRVEFLPFPIISFTSASSNPNCVVSNNRQRESNPPLLSVISTSLQSIRGWRPGPFPSASDCIRFTNLQPWRRTNLPMQRFCRR